MCRVYNIDRPKNITAKALDKPLIVEVKANMADWLEKLREDKIVIRGIISCYRGIWLARRLRC